MRWLWQAYRFVPHLAVNRSAAAVARLRAPRAWVQWGIRTWIERASIDMVDYQDVSYSTIEDFFLRRLEPDARPIGRGIVAPADGTIVGLGRIRGGDVLQVKGKPYSLARLINGRDLYNFDVRTLEGGWYVTTFLHPSSYHFVHAPFDAAIADRRWIPGRAFPQNSRALRHLSRIYERNERVVLTLDTGAARRAVLVMVGASMIGGIVLREEGAIRDVGAVPMAKQVARGDEIGHFTFGSTVVLLMPPDDRFGVTPHIELGASVQMGQSLFDEPTP